MEPCSDTKGASEIASGATDNMHIFKGISRRRVVQINQLFDGPTYQNSWAFLFRSPFVANESSGGPAWQAHRHRTHPPTHITIRTPHCISPVCPNPAIEPLAASFSQFFINSSCQWPHRHHAGDKWKARRRFMPHASCVPVVA